MAKMTGAHAIVKSLKKCGIDTIFTLPGVQLDNLFNALYDEQDSIQFRGKGEIFDFSVEPPAHERFAFGGEAVNPSGYRITSKCTACWLCIDACPVDVISEGTAENGGATSSSFNLCQA